MLPRLGHANQDRRSRVALRYNRPMLMRSFRIAWLLVVSAVVATTFIVLVEMAGVNLVTLAE
jgi:hypothetical protein